MRLAFLDLAPEALEVIELALLGSKDVDNRVPQVEQDPAAVGVALDPLHRVAFGFGALGNRVGDRARLNLRAAGNDDERVGEDRAPAYVDGDKIFALFLERGVANDVD